ncbi:MAG TPA: pilus assembly protein TadG-related protein [Bryobacteraceae bacterium]|nr:pilus assembly protein TadG-related protein [Bryobacteraceae bacterium]
MNKAVIAQKQGGFVLITMAGAAFAMFGALGLAVDMGRVFISKNETQAFCDAAALAAGLKIDGTTDGINKAVTAVNNSTNGWNFGTTLMSGPSVTFSTAPGGPWTSNPSPATGYIYVKVEVTVPVKLYFLPVVVNQYSQNVVSRAIAGQIAQTSFTRGLGPLSAVASDLSSPTFGLVVGNEYDIQWPAYNGTRAGCSPATPDNCFVRPTCSGEPQSSKAAVTQYWGASTNGYWGGSANSVIYQQILNLVQLQPVTVGQTITMTTGNKSAIANALDTRVNQDGDTHDNVLAAYLNDSHHNGRRLIALPVLNPTAAGTYVVGYASFLLIANGTSNNYYAAASGNEPFCAIYAGPYVLGAENQGGNTGAGSFKVQLVQ